MAAARGHLVDLARVGRGEVDPTGCKAGVSAAAAAVVATDERERHGERIRARPLASELQ
jgi:hypothetical protein